MSRTNVSVHSSQSKRSGQGGMKMISRPVEVDETLFGKNGKNIIGNTMGSNAGMMDTDTKSRAKTMKTLPENTQKVIKQVRNGDYNHPELMVLTAAELERMKNEAIIISKEEELNQKRILDEQKEKQQAAAKARKQRMQEMEESRKKNEPLSDLQLEERDKNDVLLNRAQAALLEQTDEVKHMNQMVMYAKCVTVRDRQLDEKKRVREGFKVEEKRKDLMLEIDRLKKIKFYEEEEKKKKEEIRRGHEVIIDQIKDRELERLREKEEEEKEGQVMIKAMMSHQKEEAEGALKKKGEQKKRLDEIFDANQKSTMVKQKRILEEKEEEEKIVKYNIEKAQKEAEYVAEQQRIKDEKEKEVQRLREQQERAYDRQAEIDALRAKRAMEEGERRARDKERREHEWREKKNEELNVARAEQAYEKQRRLEDQAKLDRDEFQGIIQTQKIERDNELKQEIEKNAVLKKHAEELRKQIAMNEEMLKQKERDKYEEGKKIRDNLETRKKMLDVVKEDKLNTLKGMNIPGKYQSELERKKIAM